VNPKVAFASKTISGATSKLTKLYEEVKFMLFRSTEKNPTIIIEAGIFIFHILLFIKL
jgi:hypothetical protein